MKKLKNIFQNKSAALPAFVSIVLLLLINLILYCQRGTKTSLSEDALDSPAATRLFSATKIEEELKVLQFSPEGELVSDQTKKEVVVVFNHPLVPLSNLEEETKGVFKIQPEVKGTFRWYGSRICAFQPEVGWEAGESYKVIVPSGLSSLNDKKLKEDVSFQFLVKPEKFNITYTSPYSGSTIKYKEDFKLYFNKEVDLDELKKNLTLKAGGKNFAYTLEYTKPEYYSEDQDQNKTSRNAVLLKPSDSFPRDADVSISISSKVKSLDKKSNFEADVSFNFKTYGPVTISISEPPKTYQERWYYSFQFSNPVKKNEAMKAFQFNPPISMKETDSEEVTSISVTHWDIKPGTKYSVKVNKFKDVLGNELTGTTNFTLFLPDYEPNYTLDETYNNVIESKMKQKLPVTVYNMSSVPVKVGRFGIDEVLKSISTNSYDDTPLKNAIKFQNIDWNTGLKNNQAGQLGFDLSPYLNRDKVGWVAFEANNSRNFVQSTDIGLTVKKGTEGSTVWANSLTDASPIKGLTVSLYDKTKKSLGKCVTNSEGSCSISHSIIEDPFVYIAEGTDGDKAYITSSKNEIYSYSIGAKRELYGNVLFDRKLYRPGDTVKIKAILGTDANGNIDAVSNSPVKVEIVDATGSNVLSQNIVTTKEGGLHTQYKIPEGSPLGHYRVSVGDGDGKVSDTFQVEEFRPVTFGVNVVTDSTELKVGSKANLTIKGEYLFGAPLANAPLNYTSTRAQKYFDFENLPGYVFGDDVFPYSNYSDFSYAGYYKGGSAKLDASGKYVLEMNFEPMKVVDFIDKPTRKEYPMSDSYSLKLEATVKDIDDKSVTKNEFFNVLSGNFLIGIKTTDRYQSNDKPFQFEIIATNTEGTPVEGKRAVVRVISKKWNAVKTQGASSSTQFSNKLTQELVEEKEINLGKEPYKYSFNASGVGEYTVTVQEKDGFSFSRVSVYAYGKQDVSWSFRDDDSISLISDKKSYKLGDTAKVVVESPYKKAKAIVTLERDNIIWQKTMDIESGKLEPINIPIKEEYLPNVFLSVALIKPRTLADSNLPAEAKVAYEKEDLGAPTFKKGLIALSVNTSSKIAKLEVKADKEFYKPRENVKISIQSEPNAEITLSVADRGVLDLVNYNFPNPIVEFYQVRPHQVKTFDNRKLLIRQYRFTEKGESPGGDFSGSGGGDQGSGGFTYENEDGTRKDIRYTAYWEPTINTDASGKAEVEFKLPDNLTTFKIMAYATVKGKFNSKSTEIKVKKPVIIQKLVPAFIRPGDQLEVGAVVLNQTPIGTSFQVKLESNLLKLESNIKKLEIPAKTGKEITFSVSLNLAEYQKLKKSSTQKLPPVKLKMSVEPENIAVFAPMKWKANDVSDALAFEFPIKEDYTEEAFSISGFTDTKAEEFLKLPPKDAILPEMSSLEVQLTSTALNGLNHGFRFFASNPYFCLEQRASAYLLSITSGDLLKEFAFTPPSNKDYDFQNISSLFLGELSKFQNADGSFRLWQDSQPTQPNPYLTAYIAYILQTAKEKDQKFDSGALNRAIQFLKSYIRTSPKNQDFTLESLSLINYVFASQKDESEDLSKTLLEKKDKLSLRGKAYLALSIAAKKGISNYKEDKDVEAIFREISNSMEVTTDKVSIKESVDGSIGYSFYSGGSTLGVVLKALIALDKENPLIPNIVKFVIKNNSKVWSDSHSTGSLAVALSDYYNTYEKDNLPDSGSVYNVTLAANPIVETKFKAKELKVNTYQFGYNDNALNTVQPDTNQPLTFSKQGSGRLYYRATLKYSPISKKLRDRDEGIEIRKQILPMDPANKPKGLLTTLKRGEIYLCKLSVVNPKPYFNFVISSPVPANSEIVNTSFNTESFSLGANLSKKQDNGNWWENIQTRTEYREDRVIITGEYLSPGIHEYYYLLRPTVKGKAASPATSAKLMYEPEVFGRTSSSVIEVQ